MGLGWQKQPPHFPGKIPPRRVSCIDIHEPIRYPPSMLIPTPIRVVLLSLLELAGRRDVVVVAGDRAEAVEIAKEVCRWAVQMGIAVANSRSNCDPDAPRVSVRGLLEPVKQKRFYRPTSVLVAPSAALDRALDGQWAGVGRCRLVVTSVDGRIPEEV